MATIQADGHTESDFQAKRNEMVRSLVRNIRHYQQEVKGMERELKKLVKTLGSQLETMTGMEFLTACAFISEIVTLTASLRLIVFAMYAGHCSNCSWNRWQVRNEEESLWE
ncbi:hypothetical protein [Paenibacillus sp. SI8]|uniref:hypothetical protein n=1 Tax=unclassified Paenibacillus TaxID=185978 RepID=UPI003465AB27